MKVGNQVTTNRTEWEEYVEALNQANKLKRKQIKTPMTKELKDYLLGNLGNIYKSKKHK